MDFTIAQTAAICVPPPKIIGISVDITSPAIPARVGSPTAPIACIASISSVSGSRPAFFNPSSTTFVFKSWGFVGILPLTFSLASYPRALKTPRAVVVPAAILSPITR